MSWDKTKPANDELLINFPAQCRANWDALEVLTEAALQITNAKIADSANIADTKLAQITTANKIHGSSITGLVSVPSAAGVLPDANSPHKLKADSLDTTPQYLDGLIDTVVFEISAGDLLQIKDQGITTQKLEGGSASPGNDKYYGTNAVGTKGFYDRVKDLNSLNDVVLSGVAQGDILIRGASSWINLAADNGKFLKSQGAGANPIWADATTPLGSWVSRSINTIYQAATDGFVVVDGQSVGGTMTFYTDSSNPPTTRRGYMSGYGASSTATYPVKKNDYWTATVSGFTPVIWWIPLGS